MTEGEVFPANDITMENLSLRAVNVCRKAGLSSVGKVLEYYRVHGTFLALDNCGKGTESELEDLCARYGQEPSVIVSPIPSVMPEQYRGMRLDCLKPYIPHSLFKELIAQGVLTVGHLYDMNFREFSSKNGLPVRLVERLRVVKTTMHNNPPKIVKVIEAHTAEIKLPTAAFRNEAVLPHDFIGAFEQVLVSFLPLCRVDRANDVLARRFGLEGSNSTLEEIGMYLGKTREWIRQIERKCLAHIHQLLRGNGLSSPFCSCDDQYVACIRSSLEAVIPALASERTVFLSRIDQLTGFPTAGRRAALLGLIEHIWGIECTAVSGRTFVLGRGISKDLFAQVARSLVDTLSQRVVSCDLFDLTVAAKQSLRKRELPNNFVQGVVSILPDVIEKEPGKYELNLLMLPTLKDKAYRILFEEQDSMSYNDIWREIAHRYAQCKIKPKGSAVTLSSQLSMDQRFTAIGRSGIWALTEWKLNSQTLVDIMSTYLHTKNSPASTSEIANYVRSVRPRANKQSVHSLLHIYDDTFVKIADGRHILKTWASSYDTTSKKSNSRVVSPADLFAVLNGIFQDHGYASLTSTEIKKAINANSIPWGWPTFTSRITKCAYLIKSKTRSKNSYTFDRRAAPPAPRLRGTISATIKAAVTEMLSRTPDPVPLATIIKALRKQGQNKGTIYRIIDNTPEFSKSSSDHDHVFISLRSLLPLAPTTLSARVTSFLQMLRDGESNTVEFKSSLRWDLNTKAVNQELEFVIAKTIAGFLNTRAGTLFIGVDDNGKAIGLEDDYKTFKKANSDTFLLHLTNIISKYLSKEAYTYVLPSKEVLDGKDICVVSVDKSPNPIYVNHNGEKEFYTRVSNSTHKLDLPEVVAYVRANWDSN